MPTDIDIICGEINRMHDTVMQQRQENREDLASIKRQSLQAREEVKEDIAGVKREVQDLKVCIDRIPQLVSDKCNPIETRVSVLEAKTEEGTIKKKLVWGGIISIIGALILLGIKLIVGG